MAGGRTFDGARDILKPRCRFDQAAGMCLNAVVQLVPEIRSRTKVGAVVEVPADEWRPPLSAAIARRAVLRLTPSR